MNDTPTKSGAAHLAIFTSIIHGGGIQASMRDLAVALVDMGYQVDLVVCHGDKTTEQQMNKAGVRCVVLSKSSSLRGRLLALHADPGGWKVLLRPVLFPLKSATKIRYLAALRSYLEHAQPDALVGAGTQCNLVALWARQLAQTATRITVTERNMLSNRISHRKNQWRWRYAAPLISRTYASADVIGGVSGAAADNLAEVCGLKRDNIAVLYNPTVNDRLRAGAREPVTHPWFQNRDQPLILSVGRLVEQKDPATLLKAFAIVRQTRSARLVMVGDGPLRDALQTQATTLGIADDIAWIGWSDNPFAYMAAADVMVLSSLWEGLPGVLIQALACGCPVVATDCPGGSAEILQNGSFGRLVPMRDANTMADAITATLAEPADSDRLKMRGNAFASEQAAQAYAETMLHGHKTQPESSLQSSHTATSY